MKKIILLFLILFVSFFGFSQTKEIDSLKNLLKNKEISAEDKIDMYVNLNGLFVSVSMDSLHKYVSKAEELSIKNNNYKLSRIYSDHSVVQMINFNNPDSARYYLDLALIELEKKDDIKIRASVYSNYGMSYQDSDDFDKTIYWNLKTINLLKDNPTKLCHAHYNQGFIYESAGMHNKATKHYKLAYEISKQVNNKTIQSLAISGLSYRLIEDKKLDSAKMYLEEGLKLCESTQIPQICYQINSDIGPLYDNLKMYDKSEKSYVAALKFAKIRNYPQDIMGAFKGLGIHKMERQQYEVAIDYFKKYDSMFVKEQRTSSGVEVFKNWANAEEKQGNFKKSNELYKRYVSLEKDRLSKENRSFIAQAEEKYESEKKDKELAEQKLQLEQNETQLQKKKIQYSYMTGTAVVLLVGSVLLWFLYQQRQRRKDQEIITLKREQQVRTLESLMEGEEKERIRIAKELHDGVNVDLSAIKYKLTSLLEKNNEVINEAVAMIDKSCEQVRAISHNLIPPSLKDFSLIETVEDFCTTANSLHEPEIVFNHIGEPIHISKKAEVNIFRIVQELVNNSVKHAAATEIAVQISHRENVIQLTVEDNGKGFDREKVSSDGIGLKNIQSRVDYLNAKLDFDSGDKGTSYIVDINTNELV